MPPNPIHTFTATLRSGFLSIRPLHKISHWSEMTKRKVDRMADFHGVALVSSSQGRQACRRPLSGKSALRRAPLPSTNRLHHSALTQCKYIYVRHVCVKKVIALTVLTTVLRPTNCENRDSYSGATRSNRVLITSTLQLCLHCPVTLSGRGGGQSKSL